ncbi:hypothetical protein RN001_000301 [Aquatica leii]|uniref:Uncharacterized protein n=1 Tax=Aquatica leii TaxID=1421715 RepID=A0AAN7Q9J2_9COLE|nr:hypothetical protein RN001_000301 [Aquatica leii]
MNEDYNKAGFVIVLCLIVALVFFIRKYIEYKKRELEEQAQSRRLAQQSSEVWNISGRVAQDGVMAPDSQRWPTHDHRLSIDSFVLANSVHISQKNQIPPPLYCEVDLPTYEQATGTSLPKTDVPTVQISSSSSRNLDHSTS